MSLFVDDTLPILDRSTLERYATCPAQAVYVAGNPDAAGYAAAVGSEAHNAISRTLTAYTAAQGLMSPRDFREALESELRLSRPDVQPEVIRSMRPVVYRLAEAMAGQDGVHFQNILKYDGGAGEKSGQLAVEFDGVTITSEVDLLHATRSKELLKEHDWKTGWGTYDEQDVFDSFQFQMHWFLIAKHYPEVEELRVTVWNTRIGKPTRPVSFDRSHLQAIETRIRSAVTEWRRWREMPLDLVDAWPTVEKCRICPASLVCPETQRKPNPCEADPVAFLDSIVAVAAKLEAMQQEATAYVDKTGRPITHAGSAFGRDKPKAARKPAAVLYTIKGSDDGEE